MAHIPYPTPKHHGEQWTLDGLAQLSNAVSGGDHNICIAIIDGPVDTSHDCFVGANIKFLPSSVERRQGSRHGTHVTSVVLGQVNTSVHGIAHGCTGLLAPVYGRRDDGTLSNCSQRELAKAINLARDHGAHVIAVSGGELRSPGSSDPYLREAVRRCAARNVLVVAAAGNDGSDCDHIPATLPSVLAVGAVDANGQPLPFSNWGERTRAQGVVAPGASILGAVPGDGVWSATGTSFAVPVVVGAVALLLAGQLQNGGPLDPLAVGAAILAGSTPCNPHQVRECDRILAGHLCIEGACRELGLSLTGLVSTSAADGAGRDPHGPSSAHIVYQHQPIYHDQDTMNTTNEPNVSPAATPPQSPSSGGESATSSPGDLAFSLPAKPAAVADSPVVAPSHGDNLKVPPALARQAAPEISSISPSQTGGRVSSPPRAPSGVSPCSRSSMIAQGFPSPDTQLVFALGQLSYDFGTEARRDYFIQQFSGKKSGIFDPQEMARYLSGGDMSSSDGAYQDANALIWTLSVDGIPVYAIHPADQFALLTYARLVQFLLAQETQGVERISIAGEITGNTRLFNGEVVPTVKPVFRGLFNWSTEDLVDAVCQKATEDERDGVRKFLERIYYELRNLGTTPTERAMNYAATNAYQAHEVFADAMKESLSLDKLEVERSPINRPGSDCWDVKMIFFDPLRIHERARRVYRYTVDVVDIVPVTVGKLRLWDMY